MTMEQLLTVEDAMKHFGVTRQTIYKMCISGTLEWVKIGRAYRFRPEWFGEAVERLRRR